MRFLVIENRMTRNAISASTFPGHPRCNSIPSCWVSMLRGVRFCSSLHLLSDTFGAGKHAPKLRTCILYGVMIPYGTCLVNYARCRPAPNRNRTPPHGAFAARYAILAPELVTGLLILVLNNSDLLGPSVGCTAISAGGSLKISQPSPASTPANPSTSR